MFNNIKDLAYQRNWKQAIGFYITYTLVLMCVLAIYALPTILIMRMFSVSNDAGTLFLFNSSFVVATLYNTVLSILIIRKKKIRLTKVYIALFAIMIILPLLSKMTPLITLLVPAILTTKPSNRPSQNIQEPQLA